MSRRALLAIFAVALGLRLVYWIQARDFLWMDAGLLDAQVNRAWAETIRHGDLLTRHGGPHAPGGGAFFMNPGYAYWLAAVTSVIGTDEGRLALLQLFIGAAVAAGTAAAGAALAGPSAGWAAGLLAAAYRTAWYYEAIPISAGLINALNLAVLLCLSPSPLRGEGGVRGMRWILGAGLLTGLSALFRPTALLWAGLVGGWLALNEWRENRSIRLAGIFLGGVVLVLAPGAIRNRMLGGEWVLTTASGGMNFYKGNNPSAGAIYRPLPFESADPRDHAADFMREAERRTGRRVTVSGMSSYWSSEAFRFIREQPVAWAKNLVRKAALFWHPTEIPMNFNLYFFQQFVPFLRGPWTTFGLVAPLALAGLIICRRAAWWPVHSLALVGFLTPVLFFVNAEYRFPVALPLILLAGAAVGWAWDAARLANDSRARQDKPFRFVPAAVLAASVLLYNGLALAFPYHLNFAIAFANLGNAHLARGEYQPALEAYQEAARRDPGYGGAWYNMGVAYLQMSRWPDARAALEQALARSPGSADIQYNLAVVEMESGSLSVALSRARATVALKPDQADGWNLLGAVYARMGRRPEAAEALGRALALDPSLEEARKNLLAVTKR